MSVMEGDSVTLNTDFKVTKEDKIIWYYNNIRIAQINSDPSKTCTDVQCNEGTERFRDRLKLDHQTGSLTVTNTRTTDSGHYKLKIISRSSDSEKTFSVSVRDRVFVMEGDSVTVHTDVETNQLEKVIWYFNDIRIAQINRDQSKVCTDVQCKERFRDRLKLDHQTGSLTITHITNTDSGEYKLKIFSSSDSEKIFSVSVHGVSAAERENIKKKEGESVTLDHGEVKNTNYSMTWYFNDFLITGDQSQICTDDQCKERFRDRLKLDHQTGSLTITHTTNTDSGEYKLQISSSRFSIIRSFSVSVTAVSHSGPSVSGKSAVFGGVFLLLVLAAAVIYYWHRRSTQAVQYGNGEQNNDPQGMV